MVQDRSSVRGQGLVMASEIAHLPRLGVDSDRCVASAAVRLAVVEGVVQSDKGKRGPECEVECETPAQNDLDY
jgi:hypothetical protein